MYACVCVCVCSLLAAGCLSHLHKGKSAICRVFGKWHIQKLGTNKFAQCSTARFCFCLFVFFFWMHVCMCQRISFAMELVVMIDDNRVWGENQLFRLIKIVFVNGDVRHMTRSSSNEQIAYTFANAQHQQQQQRHQHKLCLNLNSLISNEMCEWKRSFSNTVYILLTVHRVSLYLCVLCWIFSEEIIWYS